MILERQKLRPAAPLLILAFVFSSLQALAADSQAFSALLRDHAHATEIDLKHYSQSGGVVAKVLPDFRKGEVAVVGVVRIPVPLDFFLGQFRHIDTFKKGPAVLSVGEFATPPAEENLSKLTLDSKEIDALGTCRPARCSLKLSAAMMDRLRSQAATLGRGPKLENEFRAALLDYVSSYVAKGTPAMIAYNDTEPPIESSREFLDLLGEFGWLEQYAPGLLEILRGPFQTTRPEIDQFLYWSKESFGLKPVVSVTHVLILKITIAGSPWAFIASKQIYADHYFESSLGLTVLSQDSADPANTATSVAYFNRTMTDGLRSWFASFERSIIDRRVRIGMAKNMSQMKDALVKAYGERR